MIRELAWRVTRMPDIREAQAAAARNGIQIPMATRVLSARFGHGIVPLFLGKYGWLP